MAYVTGSAWIERSFADGLRKCLADEYTDLYVFSLRGDIRKNMLSSGAAQEGGNVFGSGSMTGIAIALFVKNPAADTHGNIHFHDIGNDLGREEKLEIISQFGSVNGISKQGGWQKIVPDGNHDWLHQVNPNFDRFLVLGDKNDKAATPVFRNYSLGVATGRDSWCYNASRDFMERNIRSMIEFYNPQRIQYHQTPKNRRMKLNDFIDTDKKKISWTVALKQGLEKNKALAFDEGEALISAYRPFTKRWMYYSRRLNERVYQMPQIFPNAGAENRVICVTGVGARAGFSALMVDAIPSLDMVEKGQCFPLSLYDKLGESDGDDLFQETGNSGYRKQDGISDTALTHFQSTYPDATIIKEDLFYYLYGILHSEDYRDQFRNNLMKQLPRLPVVSDVADFRAFRDAGLALAALHLGYEKVEPFAVTINAGEGLPQTTSPETLYRVVKMKHDKGKDRKPDLTRVIYNAHITLSDIPLEAYDYVVNGKSAIAWVMERQGVKTDKASGIVNDANNYAIETMQNPAYPLELLQRIITVSIETMKVVRGLPPLRV